MAELEAENAALRDEDEPEPEPDRPDPAARLRRRMITATLAMTVFMGGGAAAAFYVGAPVVGAMVIVLAAMMVVFVAVLQGLIEVVPPGFVLVVIGRPRTRADGSQIGYRVIASGRCLRIPIIETVERLDCRPRSVETVVRNAYSKGNAPLTIEATAQIRVASAPPRVGNAIERFLGRSTDEIDRVAVETLEGNLRQVVAALTPDEIRGDPEAFADALIEHAAPDLAKLGIELDRFAVVAVEAAS